MKEKAAMFFRLVAVFAIGWMIHRHHLRVTAEGDRPILISEAKIFLPEAHTLRPDPSPHGGMIVLDQKRQIIGTIERTMPHSREIHGYSGPSDVLAVYDRDQKVLGIAIRHSYDTPSHVEDVAKDYVFMERWNGLDQNAVAQMMDLKKHKVYGVSGATRTSEAVAQSVALRAGVGRDTAASARSFRFRWQDGVLMLLACLGVALSFWKKPLLQRRKTWIHILMVIYLGVISGDLLAQSLLISWIEHGIPWRTLVGLAFLAAAAFAIPWATGKPTYCTHICPHGHAQRWLMKLIPAKKKVRLGADEKWSFKALPALLLIVVLIITFLKLPLDLAGFEPFDAWSIRGAGIATLVVAAASLIFSLFVPMGYCKYGCPTGMALNLVKREKSGFVRRDLWLLALLAISLLLYFGYGIWKPWLLK